MGTQTRPVPSAGATCARGAASTAAWALWRLLTFPLLALVIILEPVMRFVLSGLALLLTLMAFFWKLAAPPGLHVPFIGMLGAAIGCMAVLAAYYWMLRMLSA